MLKLNKYLLLIIVVYRGCNFLPIISEFASVYNFLWHNARPPWRCQMGRRHAYKIIGPLVYIDNDGEIGEHVGKTMEGRPTCRRMFSRATSMRNIRGMRSRSYQCFKQETLTNIISTSTCSPWMSLKLAAIRTRLSEMWWLESWANMRNVGSMEQYLKYNYMENLNNKCKKEEAWFYLSKLSGKITRMLWKHQFDAMST